jgi:hypothetical protein
MSSPPDVKTVPLRSVISMNQQSILMYLSPKGLNAVDIHNNIVATLKGEVKSGRTVTYYLRKPSFSSPKTPQPSESPTPILNESDKAILLALSEEWFASVWHLTRRTHLHHSTVHDRLTYKLLFTLRHLFWVTHLLSEADKHGRAQLSFELLEMLQHQKDRVRHYIVKSDKSWFYFTTNHERIWPLEEPKPRRRSRSPFN